MILFQNSAVTITGQKYFSAKSQTTSQVVLATLTTDPDSYTFQNLPSSHTIIYNSTNKQFIFKHSTLTEITLSEGKYSVQITMVFGSTTVTLVFLVYVVKDYRVEEHVFEGQSLTGFLNEESRTLQDSILSIFVCEKDTNAIYKRYEYKNLVNQPIDAIVLAPQKKVSIDNVEGVKHQEYSIELQPTAPIEKIFERFIDLQNQPFIDSEVNEDTLFAYLRLTESDGTPICEGIIDTQDGRFQFKYETETKEAKRVDESDQSTTFTYRISNSITLQLYSPSTLLKAVAMVDNVSSKIDYTNKSDGQGFVDYLYNEFVSLPFTITQKENGFKIYDIIERFAKYINRQSVLAKAGILQSTSESMEAYGYNQLCAVALNPDPFPQPNDFRSVTIVDIIDAEIFLFNFILSDTFGEGEQANGEKRSYTVERTRGLRDRNGKFPRRDSEEDYSFLLLDNAEELLNLLTFSTAYLPAFEVITESAGAGNHKRYKLRTLLTRKMNRGEKKGNLNNIIEIDKTSKTLNVIDDGEIDAQNDIIRQFDQISQAKIEFREIDGFGQEYEEGINDGFFVKNIVEIRNQNEVRAVGATNLQIDEDIVIASKRRTRKLLNPFDSIKRNQLSLLVSNQRTAPIMYAVILKDYIRFTSYFAEALLLYEALESVLLRVELIENVQINNLDLVKLINEATVLKTNLLSDSNTMHFYKVIDADIDIVGKSAVLKVERVKSPFLKYDFTVGNETLEVKYDEPFVRWHGAVARRIFTPFNSAAYPSIPISTQFSTTLTADEKKELCFVQYSSGSGIYGDSYQGVNVRWQNFTSPKLTVVRVQDGKRSVVLNDVSVPSSSDLYTELIAPILRDDVYKRNARYIIDVKNANGTGRVAAIDVAKGCLVVRSRPSSVTCIGVQLKRFVDKLTPKVESVGTNQQYYLYVESIFTYRGRFCLFSFDTSQNSRIQVDFHETYVRIRAMIESPFPTLFPDYFLYFDEAFKAGEEIHFEIEMNNTFGLASLAEFNIRINGMNYTKSDLSTTPPNPNTPIPYVFFNLGSFITYIDSDNSYVCVRLFRAYAREGNQWIRICDLSFNDIGANDANEPFMNPSAPYTSFCTMTNPSSWNIVDIDATENISIQPEIAFKLPQL